MGHVTFCTRLLALGFCGLLLLGVGCSDGRKASTNDSANNDTPSNAIDDTNNDNDGDDTTPDDDDNTTPPFTISVDWPTSALTTCQTGMFTVSSSNASGGVTYNWDFGNGATDHGASVSHRFLKPGSIELSVTATDAENHVATATHTLTVTALDRDTTLRFALDVAAPDRINYIRSVTIDAQAIGISNPIRLLDDGRSGGDVTASDGTFSGIARTTNCSNIEQYLNQNITATAVDATGVTRTLELLASDYVVP